MKPDKQDLEHLRQVTRSRGLQLIVERLRAMRDAKVRELIQPSDAQHTAELRGYIAGVEACLAAPGALERELAGEGGTYGRKAQRGN